MTPIKDLSNGHVGYTVVARNITERKRMEKALIQKEKLKTLGEISAEVAHEIRNPLVSIGGFARRLQERFPDLPEVKIILRESERLERILDGIRDYLKPVEVRATKCSVNDIIRECVNLLSPQLKRRALTYQLNLDPHLPMGLVDPDILRQICINLIRNAADSAEAGGMLVIETAEGNTYLNILFKNPVRSFKIKDPKLLFLPFGEGGQSIGLPLCYRLLKDMGGLISFSEEGGFVVFTISLPKLPWSESKEDHSSIAS